MKYISLMNRYSKSQSTFHLFISSTIEKSHLCWFLLSKVCCSHQTKNNSTMLKFVLLVSAVTTIASASYGHGGGYGGSFYGHSVPAAVISKHHVKHYDVHTPKHYIHPTTIDVPANYLPVNFVFRSASSPIHVAQKHESAKGSYQATHSYGTILTILILI